MSFKGKITAGFGFVMMPIHYPLWKAVVQLWKAVVQKRGIRSNFKDWWHTLKRIWNE